jgi:hypothetical protein
VHVLNVLQSAVHDPVLLSVFRQVTSVETTDTEITIALPKTLQFYQDVIERTRDQWQEAVKTSYNTNAPCIITFHTQEETNDTGAQHVSAQKPSRHVAEKKEHKNIKTDKTQNNRNSKVRDMSQYPKLQLVLEHFPGRVIIEDTYEEKTT